MYFTYIFFIYWFVFLKLFDDRMLIKVFGTKKDEVTGEWRRLYKEELSDLYFSTNIRLII